MRIGHGYDVHRFAEGDFITLGGVRIAHGFGLLAHSDAEMVTSIVELIDSPAVRMRIRAHNTAVPPTIAWHNVLARCETLYQQAFAAQSRSRIRWVERRFINTAARR